MSTTPAQLLTAAPGTGGVQLLGVAWLAATVVVVAVGLEGDPYW